MEGACSPIPGHMPVLLVAGGVLRASLLCWTPGPLQRPTRKTRHQAYRSCSRQSHEQQKAQARRQRESSIKGTLSLPWDLQSPLWRPHPLLMRIVLWREAKVKIWLWCGKRKDPIVRGKNSAEEE